MDVRTQPSVSPVALIGMRRAVSIVSGVVSEIAAARVTEPHHGVSLRVAVVLHAATVRAIEVQATMDGALLDVKA